MDESKNLDFRTFLESVPPLEARLVTLDLDYSRSSSNPKVIAPAIYLHCPGENCRGPRFYDYTGYDFNMPGERQWRDQFLVYRCRNCNSRIKTYAMRITHSEPMDSIQRLIKVGEMPRYGEPRPNVCGRGS